MSWKNVPISALGTVVTGKTPSTKNQSFWGGNHPFITPSDIDYGNYYCRATERTVSEKAKVSFKGQWLPKDAILFTCIGNTIGKCALSPSECLTNQQINSIIVHHYNDPKFVYYLLINNIPIFRNIGLGGGSATPIINKSAFAKVQLKVPSKEVQNKIAKILSTYDDLIENNLRRTQLLEQAARLIYEEWFIRFRFPEHEKVRIVNGLPEHWKMGVISDLFQTGSGGTPSRKENGYYGGDIKWVKTQELKNGYVINTDETISESGLKNSSAKLFPKNTVLMAMYGATIGQLGILNESMASNQACCALIPKTNENYFIFAFLYFLANKEKLIKQSKGSAQNNVSQEIVKNFPLLIPSLNLLDSFTHNLLPSFELIANLQVQNLRLKEARDLLLPKLMNGEIQV